MLRKTILLLGGGIESVPMVEMAKRLGLRVIVADGNPDAPARSIADVFLRASCYHIDEVLNVIAAIPGIDGVVCAATDAPLVAAEIGARLGLPGLSVKAARLGTNKFEQKRSLATSGIPMPRYAQLVTHDRVSEFARGVGGKVVVKPVDSRGGRGVSVVRPEEDSFRAYREALAESPSGSVMVEEWLDGPQLSTESIVVNGGVLFTGIALRNYDRLEEFSPHVIEDGCDAPYGDNALRYEVERLIGRSCKALGWDDCTVKGDLVVHEDQVYVIELACRLSGGFLASHTLAEAYGVDIVGAAIDLAIGAPLFFVIPPVGKNVCQRYVFPGPGDIGKRVVEINVPGGLPFHTYNIRVGDIVKPVDCHPRRWGQAVAVGPEARMKADETVEAMKRGVVLE